MADIQCQLQNIITLADVANTQLAEIKTTILQASDIYRTQIASDIFSISEDLQDIIQGNMKNQVYHIQSLLANKLDRYKGKRKFLYRQLYKGNTRCIQNQTARSRITNDS